MKTSFPTAIFILVLAFFSSGVSGQAEPFRQYLDHPWVDSVLSTLSVEEQAAQSLWVTIGPDDDLQDLMEISGAVRDHGLGGLIFTENPGEQMIETADYCRSFSKIPPAVALEGRWDGQYPDAICLAAIESDSVRYLAGANLARQLRKEGVSLLISKELDRALAAGLSDGNIRIMDPLSSPGPAALITRIDAAGIGEIRNYLEAAQRDDTIVQRARQVLALKYWIRQHEADPERSVQEKEVVAITGQSAFIRDLYARSLTVLKNRNQLIPLKELENARIACLAVNQESLTEFQMMAAMYTRSDNFFWSEGNENSDALIEQLASYDLVLSGLYPGRYGEKTEAFLSSLCRKTKLVGIWFGNPAGLEGETGILAGDDAEGVEGLILAYSQNPFTERLSAQLIFGGIAGRGILPVALGDQYPVGHGINTAGGLRLQYGFPENAGLCSTKLNHAIDSIARMGLDSGAYPGCQVIVARKGTVVFHKAYGHHTYDRRIEVRKNDLYDLASVSKVSGPLAGLMLLEGMGRFSYRDHLGDYCDAMKGSDKADLALKDILAHRAGLYPWIPYHEKTLKKNGHYKRRFIRPDREEKFTIEVADRLYLSNTFKKKIFKEIRKSELGEQKYLYSGLAFFLFPTIIEDLSGQPYETFLTEHVYHRLGAWELLYHPRNVFPGSRIVPTEYDSLFRKQLVHGYVHDEGAALMGTYAGNAGLFASANDLLKLIEMYRRMGSYGGEQIIPEEVLKEYTSYQFPELENRRGLGFDKPLLNENDGTPEDYPCPGASGSSFGHSGFTGTFVWADPEHEISYVFLCNRVHTTRTNQLLYNLNIRTNILQSVYDSIMEP